MLDLRELETLAAIIDEQSFDAAARKLHITPGAVSQRIKNLENRLGKSVLVRSSPPRVTLTGEQVMLYARKVLILQNEMQASLLGGENESVQTISLAVNHDSLSTWFMDVAEAVNGTYPVRFDIQTSDTGTTQKLLRAGEVQGVVTSREEPVPGCRSRYLGKMEYLPACSGDFFERYFLRGIERQALLAAPAVSFDRTDDLVARFLQRYELTGSEVDIHYFPSSHAILDAVSKSLGWSMLPRLLLDSFPEKELIVFDSHVLDVSLYWKTWSLPSSTIEALEQQIFSVAEQQLLQQ